MACRRHTLWPTKGVWLCISQHTVGKMEFCGITGTAYKLMHSYLDDRYQRTKIKDKYFRFILGT
jgi:hypothetical protein